MKIVSIGFGLAAAFFWFWSALVKIKDFPDVGLDGSGLTDVLQKQARLSGVAAVLTAVSVLAQACL